MTAMEDKNYKELIEFLGDKFGRIDNQFELVDKRFDVVDAKFEDLRNDFRQLQQSVDDYAAKAGTYFMEMAACRQSWY